MSSDHQEIVEMFREHSESDARQFEAITDAIAGSVSKMDEMQAKMDERFDSLEKKIEPLLEVYKGVLFGRNVLYGAAGLLGALATIGAAIVWIIKSFVVKN